MISHPGLKLNPSDPSDSSSNHSLNPGRTQGSFLPPKYRGKLIKLFRLSKCHKSQHSVKLHIHQSGIALTTHNASS